MTATTTGRIGRIALGDVIGRTARTCGDEIALVDEDVRISYRERDEESDRFARFLLTQTMQRGDGVAMRLGADQYHAGTGDIACIAEHAEEKRVLIDASL